MTDQRGMPGQSDALRARYEELSIRLDELIKENERLRLGQEELRERYVTAEAQRDENAREVEQLRASDRAARILLIRAESMQLTGDGDGIVTCEALREALDKGV